MMSNGGCVALPWFLRAALEDRRKFVRLEVLHLDDDLRTRVAVGPAKLETLDLSRTVVDDPRALETVLTYIAETGMDEKPGNLDARWGLIFTNAEGQRIFSLYLDKFGKRAAADGYELNLHDGERIIDWLKGRSAESNISAS
jgi:hypothetical protein